MASGARIFDGASMRDGGNDPLSLSTIEVAPANVLSVVHRDVIGEPRAPLEAAPDG